MSEETRLDILRILTEAPDINQRQLAQRLGVSLGKTNYCLQALIEKGLVKANNFRNSQHKSTYLYLLTPSGIEEKGELTVRFLHNKMAEYDALKVEIDLLHREVHGVTYSEEDDVR